MANRLDISKAYLSNQSVYVTAIDEVEQEVLGRLFSNIFNDYEKSCITIVHNPTGQQGVNFHIPMNLHILFSYIREIYWA